MTSPGTPEIRLVNFEKYGLRLESKAGGDPMAEARAAAERSAKARTTGQLMADNTDNSWSQVMWRVSLPLAALNLALLAIPLGAVNPRLGRSGDILIAGLVGLLYMNLMNLSRAWIANGKLSFGVGVWAIHGLVALLTFFLLMRRLRVKAPRNSPRLPEALAAACLRAGSAGRFGAGQQAGIAQRRFADELPQHVDALELAQVLVAVHPERARDLHLLFQHRREPGILGGDEAGQDGQRLALQRRVVLGDHAGAAQDHLAGRQQILQIAQSLAEQQFVHIADERVVRQVCP